ncbi:hypothetical protein HPB52_007152 [Rhipicephalus sanguineus]|uniref:Uncharacterized protein n=1 Tax=Rhipicephalus sanguineus TaxID=34632 RepID=A0A9D4PJC3_RHISA|nr:hypothetical protein HPB52_007152 [Rhipicephalus sanguineus]
MVPRLCPPVPPFHPVYPQSWFMQLDVILVLNGVIAQLLRQAVLLHALPVQRRHLAAASISSPQPYDGHCVVVLACHGETYHALRASSQFQALPPAQRAVPTGPWPSLAQGPTPPDTSPSTFRTATSASIRARPPLDEVQDVAAAIYQSRGVPAICKSSPVSTAPRTCCASGSTTATSPHALESARATDTVSPAVSPPIHGSIAVDGVQATRLLINLDTLGILPAATTTSSKSTAADVRAPHKPRQNVRDAATMSKDPGGPLA